MNAADTTEDRVATLHALLNDAAKKVGAQRQTISELREALRDALGYVEHWQRDVGFNLKPTLGSLSSAHETIACALAKSKTGEAK